MIAKHYTKSYKVEAVLQTDISKEQHLEILVALGYCMIKFEEGR